MVVKSTATIAVTSESWDTDSLAGGVQRMMMDGLFGFDENMQIIPMLATSYEANDEEPSIRSIFVRA